MLAHLVFFIFFFRVDKVFTLGVGESDSINSIANDKVGVGFKENSVSDLLKKILGKGCAKKYTLTCLKMDVVDLMDTLSASNTFQLLPGVSIVKDSTANGTAKKYPEKLIKNLVNQFPNQESPQLDKFLVTKVYDFLASHSISLRFMGGDNGLAKAQGRGKGPKSSLMAGVMMLKGTLMTLGFGALATLAGKALLTGLLSLIISAFIGLRNTGFQRQTTYEIISKPLYSQAHSHSAEFHDHHDHGHYSYGRNLEANNENNGGGGGGNVNSDVEYVPLPQREEEEEEKGQPNQEGYQYNAYGEVEYKTITEDDLKAYYSNLHQNRQRRPPPVYYRRGRRGTRRPTESFDSKTFVPVSTK